MPRRQHHSGLKVRPATARGDIGPPLRHGGNHTWTPRQVTLRDDWIPLVVLLIVTAGFFHKGLSNCKQLVREDAAYIFQPYYQFAAEEITSGRFPHWNPYVSCGLPFHDILQGSVLYPLRWPLFWMSYPTGYVLSLVAHFCLTGAFTYLLCRSTLRCGPVPSLIGALSFTFSGFAIGHATHPFYFMAFPWLILAVYLLSQSIEPGRWSWAVWAAVPVGLMGLVGAIPLMLMLVLGLGVWALGETVARVIQRLRTGQMSAVQVFQPALAVVTTLALGLAIAAAQLWPAQLQSSLSSRSQAGWEFITEICSHPARSALRMIVPFFYGDYRLGYWGEPNYHELASYAGLIPLTAALLAVLTCWHNRWVPRITILVAVVAIVAAGKYLPVYRLLYDYVPLFDRLRDPSRLYGWVPLGISCLGAIGLESVYRQTTAGRDRRMKLAAVIVGLVLMATTIGSLAYLNYLSKEPYRALNIASQWTRFDPNDHAEQSRILDAAKGMLDGLMARKDAVTWTGIAAAVASVMICTTFFAFRRARGPLVMYTMVVLLVIDLAAAAAGNLIFNDTLQMITDTPQEVRFLQEHLGPQRYLGLQAGQTATNFYRGMQFRIRNAIGGGGGVLHTTRQEMTFGQVIRGNRRLIDLLGVKYIVTGSPLSARDLVPVFAKGQIYIAQNKKALPLAFLASSVRVLPEPLQVLKELVAGNSDLSETAYVEEQISPLPPADQGTQAAGEILDIRDLPGWYRMRTRAALPKQLVLTESYHPHWRCAIDGKPVPVCLTDYAFMSIRVPAGEHQVEWRFEPARFKIGLAISLGALAAVTGLLLASRRGAARLEHAGGKGNR